MNSEQRNNRFATKTAWLPMISAVVLALFASCTEEGDVNSCAAMMLATPVASTSYAYAPSSSGPDLNVPRVGHSATALKDGTILIAGGNDGVQYHNTASIYDPAAGTISAPITMNHARSNHRAALLSDGTVILMGGRDATNQALNTVDIYNPSTGSFTDPGTTLTTARRDFELNENSDGNLLVVGGIDDAGNVLNTAELYNGTNFSAAGTFTGKSRGMFAGSQGSYVFHYGGTDDAGTYYSSGRLYDGTTWSDPGDALAIGVAYGSSLRVTGSDGSVSYYLTGGKNSIGAQKPVSVVRLDATTSKPALQAIKSMNYGRYHHGSFYDSVGNFVYVVGGNDGTGSLQSIEIYSVSNNTWAFHSYALLEKREQMSVTAISSQLQKFFLAGGQDGTTALKTTEVFDAAWPTHDNLSYSTGDLFLSYMLCNMIVDQEEESFMESFF